MDSTPLSENEGEISTKTVPSMYVEWNIPVSLLLSPDTKHSINSPIFHFKDATWYLRVTINGTRTRNPCGSCGAIDFHLVRKNPVTPTLQVNYHFGLKTVDGTTVANYRSENNFGGNFNISGTPNMLTRLGVCHQKSSLAPNGVLTFFCYLYTEASGSLVTVCSKELSKGFTFGIPSAQDVSYLSPSKRSSSGDFTFGIPSTQKLPESTANKTSSPRGFTFGIPSTQKLPESSENKTSSSRGFTFGIPFTQKLSESSENKTSNSEGFTFGIPSTQKLPESSANKTSISEGFTFRIPSMQKLPESAANTPSFSREFTFGIPSTQKLPESSENKTTSSDGFTFGIPSTQKLPESSENKTSSSRDFTFGIPSAQKLPESSANKTSSSGGFTFGIPFTQKLPESSTSKTSSSGGRSKLVEDIKNLFISGEDSDVTIKVKDTEFKVHKNILRARSSVFYTMFSHDMVEKNSGTIDIIDCEPEAFKIFLHYLYSGSVENLSMDTVFDLYGAADKYDAEELKLKCNKVMVSKLSADTVCDVIEHALHYNDETLLKVATNSFTLNFKKIIHSVKWHVFLKRHPVEANELFIKVSDCYVLRQNKQSI